MYGETLHQYLMYNAEDYKRPGGQMYHTYPSLKYPEDQKRPMECHQSRPPIQVIRDRRAVLSAPHQAAGQPDRRHEPAANSGVRAPGRA